MTAAERAGRREYASLNSRQRRARYGRGDRKCRLEIAAFCAVTRREGARELTVQGVCVYIEDDGRTRSQEPHAVGVIGDVDARQVESRTHRHHSRCRDTGSRDGRLVAVAESPVATAALENEGIGVDGRHVELAVEHRDELRWRLAVATGHRRQRADADRIGGLRAVVDRALRDPLADDVDLVLRKWRAPERHLRAHRGGALEFLDQVAVVRVAGLDAQERRHLCARHVDQQTVAAGRVENQTLRRAGARVAAGGRARWREYVVLDRREGRAKCRGRWGWWRWWRRRYRAPGPASAAASRGKQR